MRSSHGILRASAGAFFSSFMFVAAATPQVVGDEACERHAVDIAAFATCVAGEVVKPEADPRVPAAASSAATARGRPSADASGLSPTHTRPSPGARAVTLLRPSQSR